VKFFVLCFDKKTKCIKLFFGTKCLSFWVLVVLCLYLQSQLLLNGFFLKNVCDYFVMVIDTLKVLCIFIFFYN